MIKQVAVDTVQHINQCDGTFVVHSVLVPHVENGKIAYTLTAVPHSSKRYIPENLDFQSYLHDPNKTIFFAFVDEQLAGQIILHKNWNQFAWIQDLAVDIHFRGHGVGRALMQQAVEWARDRNLAGVMLETQNNNVQACKFYERFGFELSGFDKFLYKGLDPATDEIALYWYFIF